MPPRIALIADVHGDLEALNAALAMIDDLGIERIISAGDLVGYGVFNEEVVQLVRERGIPCVRGNHDRWAVGHGRPEEPQELREDGPYDALGLGLSSESLRFLAGLPATLMVEIEGIRPSGHHSPCWRPYSYQNSWLSE